MMDCNYRKKTTALENTGRADTEAVVLIASLIAGFIGGWWFSGRLLYGIVWAIILPVILAAGVFVISYFVNRRP